MMYAVMLTSLDLTFLHGNVDIWKRYDVPVTRDPWRDLHCILNV